MSEQQIVEPQAVEPEGKIEEHQKPRSGYGRLRSRHRSLIVEHELLQKDYFALLDQQTALQKDVERLLTEHQRIIENTKAPAPQANNWFEGANVVLNQIATQPDLRTTQVFAGALASLQQKLATIVSRLP